MTIGKPSIDTRVVRVAAMGIAAVLIIAGCSDSGTDTSNAENSETPASPWKLPEDNSLPSPHVAEPGNRPPSFPPSVDDYALANEWRTTVRLFGHDSWSTTADFPATMNGCVNQRFYVRWRVLDPKVTVEATILDSAGRIVRTDVASGKAGWMASWGCGQPGLRLGARVDRGTMANVVVEVQRWKVSA